MKKIICVLLASLIPVFMFTACAEEKEPVKVTEEKIQATVKGEAFTAGVYVVASEETESDCSLQIRAEDNKIAIQYKYKTITEPGKYTIDGNTLRVTVEKTGHEYAFNIKNGGLIYDEANSKPSAKFTKEAGVPDGTEFALGHVFGAR